MQPVLPLPRLHPRHLLLMLLLLATSQPAARAADSFPFDPNTAGAKAQDVRPQDVISWQAFQATETATHDVDVALRMNATQTWRVYVKNLKFAGPNGYTITHQTPPPSRKFIDPIEGKEVDVYEGGEFNLTLSGPAWTGATFPVAVTYVGCTNVICLFPYTQTIDLPFLALPAPTGPSATPASLAPAAAGGDTGQSAGDGDGDFESRIAGQLRKGELKLEFGISFLALVFIGGLLSNLTPCVAPMVPITLRLLARQSSSPFANASIYALGIVVTYSSLGLAAALSGGLFGSLLASKAFNLSFAAIMILLGITMLGFGEIALGKVQNLGTRLGSGKASPGNTFLMGVGAGLVAAPCTGPILAALLAYAAGHASSVGAATSMLLVYSVGFALPYVLLGGAAAKISAFRVPPTAQIFVKLLFAAVMIALGFYYLRIPFYDFMQTLRPHWAALAGVGVVAGGVLMLAMVFVPGLAQNKLLSIVPATILGLGLFASWQLLTTTQATAGTVELTWLHSEADAIAAAQAQKRPILIDMWAEWCEACKKMDITTLADPAIRAQLAQHWVLLRLDLTESTPATEAIQQKYAVQSLPTLVLLPAAGDVAQKAAINGYVSATTLGGELQRYPHQGG